MLDEIRSACAYVAARAGRVRIAGERIDEYARSLPRPRLAAPALDPKAHFLGGEKETVAYFLTLDCVNFGSGWFPHLRKPEGRSGYFTVAAALKRRFQSAGPMDAGELESITREDCSEIFGQPPDGGPRDEIMSLFAEALNDFGSFLSARYGGSFEAVLDDSGRSAERLAGILGSMRFFMDVSEYAGRRVPFFKRAQIASCDLNAAFGGRGPGEFTDLDRLTMFADNLVPHVLKLDGVLLFDRDLDARIERGELIAHGSAEEVEMRACALEAVELLVGRLRAAGTETNAAAVDNLLWERGHAPEYKSRPRHRTKCVYY